MSKEERDARDAAVLAVLNDAIHPLGPTDIGRLSGHPYLTDYATASSRVVPILRRIGAVRHKGGKYTKPEPTP